MSLSQDSAQMLMTPPKGLVTPRSILKRKRAQSTINSTLKKKVKFVIPKGAFGGRGKTEFKKTPQRSSHTKREIDPYDKSANNNGKQNRSKIGMNASNRLYYAHPQSRITRRKRKQETIEKQWLDKLTTTQQQSKSAQTAAQSNGKLVVNRTPRSNKVRNIRSPDTNHPRANVSKRTSRGKRALQSALSMTANQPIIDKIDGIVSEELKSDDESDDITVAMKVAVPSHSTEHSEEKSPSFDLDMKDNSDNPNLITPSNSSSISEDNDMKTNSHPNEVTMDVGVDSSSPSDDIHTAIDELLLTSTNTISLEQSISVEEEINDDIIPSVPVHLSSSAKRRLASVRSKPVNNINPNPPPQVKFFRTIGIQTDRYEEVVTAETCIQTDPQPLETTFAVYYCCSRCGHTSPVHNSVSPPPVKLEPPTFNLNHQSSLLSNHDDSETLSTEMHLSPPQLPPMPMEDELEQPFAALPIDEGAPPPHDSCDESNALNLSTIEETSNQTTPTQMISHSQSDDEIMTGTLSSLTLSENQLPPYPQQKTILPMTPQIQLGCHKARQKRARRLSGPPTLLYNSSTPSRAYQNSTLRRRMQKKRKFSELFDPISHFNPDTLNGSPPNNKENNPSLLSSPPDPNYDLLAMHDHPISPARKRARRMSDISFLSMEKRNALIVTSPIDKPFPKKTDSSESDELYTNGEMLITDDNGTDRCVFVLHPCFDDVGCESSNINNLIAPKRYRVVWPQYKDIEGNNAGQHSKTDIDACKLRSMTCDEEIKYHLRNINVQSGWKEIQRWNPDIYAKFYEQCRSNQTTEHNSPSITTQARSAPKQDF